MRFYMLVSSDKSIDYFPQNKPCSFSIYLKKLFQFEDNWSVALCEISTFQTFNVPTQLYIYSNICQGTYIDGDLLPLLRCVSYDKKNKSTKTFFRPYYIPISKQAVTSISFYINDINQHPASVLIKPVTITLHFKQTK